ncbi:putative LRR receptor-like serine/threonine-protein kinase [Panicum miliaceum]|uniref:LRR receptor-like serine/threonine-protein kinase n=1 Tax=Panicum miliaceum TaxID=4540 RepID=A0A3L6QF31_PANMI|nr:putative LRR receptor-like serine/threonine-protein kinase [Panicum miliaceum]
MPPEVGNLKGVISLWAHSNRLSGEIPTTLGECQLIRNLQLQNNFFEGGIPLQLSRLKGLETLDLSSNNLSGQIPMSFENLTTLHYLNLSFNNLVGEVPTAGIFENATAVSVQGNAKLCGRIENIHLPRCFFESSGKKHKFPVVPVVLPPVGALVVLLLLVYFLFNRGNKRLAKEYGAGNVVSTQGDIYSYGILILEMITGRRPTDNAFDGALGLRKHVEMALNNNAMSIIDVELVMDIETQQATVGGPSSKIRVNSLTSLLNLALLCSVETPSDRMSTGAIIKALQAIKRALAQGE